MKKVSKIKKKQVVHKKSKFSKKHFSFIAVAAFILAIPITVLLMKQTVPVGQEYASQIHVGGGSANNCEKVKGYCSTLSKGCRGYNDENSGRLVCGGGSLCCVPQPSCASVHGYCASYGSRAKSGYTSNSTYPGCGSKECFIPVGKTCGSFGGKCLSLGTSTPSGYHVWSLGNNSCVSNKVCFIPNK